MRVKALYQATKDRYRELAQSLKPKFGVDSGLVATLLTMELWARFGNPDTLPQEEAKRYLTALQRLPKGGKVPMPLVSSYDSDRYWKVLFIGGASKRCFPTEDKANAYEKALMDRIHEEINQE
jgi:hypothetical protein